MDLEHKELRLPDSKSGAKVVYVGDAAVKILGALPHVVGNPYVIVGRKEKAHLTDLQHPWRRIRKASGLGDVRIYDLRHTFASGGLLVGEGLAMIGKLLGYTQIQTTARYAHLASDPIKQAATKISDRLASAMFDTVEESDIRKRQDALPLIGNCGDSAEAA